MLCLFVILSMTGQLISWCCWLNFNLSPSDWENENRTKKNFFLLLIPLGFWYFVWVGVKKAWKFLVETYEGLS